MPDLADIHQALVEDYRESFEIAAGKLLAQPSWILEATVVVMHLHNGAVTIGPVRSLPLWLEHLPAELDAFVRLQEQGVPFEEAYAQCLAEQGFARKPPSCRQWPNDPTMSAAFWCRVSPSIDLRATAPQAPGSLFFVSPTSRDQPDLLATQLDLELIAWFEAKQSGVGHAHQQVAVALHRGHVGRVPLCGVKPEARMP